jgi:glycosyltransferase involved in cell wall biosynthesis
MLVGFGMPILEELLYGLRVISSNAASLRVVGGDAAIYFDPMRVESIVEAILTANQQPELLEQHRQAAPGVLARFCWTKAAETYVACYRAAAGAPTTPAQQALYEEAVAS